jgi:putative acetyltransferase
MTLIIRRALVSDAAGLARYMADPEIFGGLLQLPYPTEEAWRTRLTDNGTPGKTDLHLVAERDGELIGSAGLFPVGPAVRRRHAMTLGISVAVEAQGQGVGQALMAALCDYADNWVGALRIELTVFADNAPARHIYFKCGFVEEGVHRFYALRNGRYADAIAMARMHPKPPRVPVWPETG